MANLQVKSFPDALHEALAVRAQSEGVTMSAYVTAVLHQALSMPSTREWIERLRALLPPDALPALDTRGALDSARSDYDPDTRVASP